MNGIIGSILLLVGAYALFGLFGFGVVCLVLGFLYLVG